MSRQGSPNFAGFRWNSLSSLQEGSEREQHVASFFQAAAWDAVRQTAAHLRQLQTCELEPSIGLGGRHMIRIIRFDDGVEWIARLRMPESNSSMSQQAEQMQREIDCLRFVKQESNIPVPIIFGHNLQDTSPIGAATMFMECLHGNVAMDLNFNTIPPEYKHVFLRDMARLQTKITALQLPQIGTIVQKDDGSFIAGPIPGLGGPFATATAFFEAWASRARFPRSATQIRELCGPLGEDVLASIEAFPPKLGRLAQRISASDSGPFPLCHGDFGHNNIVVDDHYRVLGVIDWEDASTAPWEAMEFPLILRVIPRSIGLPKFWDADGNPTDPKDKATVEDQQTYLADVQDAETQIGLPSTLSANLANEHHLGLATSMRLFAVDGKVGWYARALDYLES